MVLKIRTCAAPDLLPAHKSVYLLCESSQCLRIRKSSLSSDILPRRDDQAETFTIKSMVIFHISTQKNIVNIVVVIIVITVIIISIIIVVLVISVNFVVIVVIVQNINNNNNNNVAKPLLT